MKRGIITGVLVLGTMVSAQAYAGCDEIVAKLSHKIEQKGVPQDRFTVEAVPNSKANQTGGSIIGNCENGDYQVVYTRLDKANTTKTAASSPDDSSPTSASEAPTPEPGSHSAPSVSPATSTTDIHGSVNGAVSDTTAPENTTTSSTAPRAPVVYSTAATHNSPAVESVIRGSTDG